MPPPDLQGAWRAEAEACLAAATEPPVRRVDPGPAQYQVLVTCRDEPHQVAVIRQLVAEGLASRALLA